MSAGDVLRYDAARRALAEAKSVDEVRDWADKAAAVREYARRAKNRDLEIDAAEIRVRAERREGELLAEMRAAGQLAEGRKKLSSADDSFRVTLDDLSITRNESSRAQKLAAIEPSAFERLAARCRARMAEEEKLHSFDVLRERDGPVNGARAVMGSRQEPDDSLDYFPTAPWATRALIEHVLPVLGTDLRDVAAGVPVVWDPACGEGHITGVLEEYRCEVIGTDIFDYSDGEVHPPAWYGAGDFLGPGDWLGGEPDDLDWIVTNPPFEEKATAFVLRALDLAGEGVAMFFRLQWLETVERYEAIFRDRPPSLIAFFAERVNLCKGRWDPDGSTATAYVWLVWKRGAEPRAPIWIPPGQRRGLERPTDRTRFTAHPVAALSVVPVARDARSTPLGYDPETGEVIETQFQAKASEDNGATGEPEGRADSVAGDASRSSAGDECPRTHPQRPSNRDASAGGWACAADVPQGNRLPPQAKAEAEPIEERGPGDREGHSREGAGNRSEAGVAECGSKPAPGASDLEIPPALRRVTLTEDERAAVGRLAKDGGGLLLNERQLVRKLAERPELATELDRSYLARIIAKAAAEVA